MGWHRELFGENYFLELQWHDKVDGLGAANDGLVKFSREMGIPLAATNDSHYVLKEHAPLQDLYVCIQTSTNVNDDKRLRMEDDSYYIKTAQEMRDTFRHVDAGLLESSMARTLEIAQECKVSLDFGQTHVPKYQTPEGMDANQYLEELCRKGFEEKYPDPDQEAIDRLRYEMEVIRYTNFANYFLVVWDIIRFVRERGILFGVRGSAAASVVLHCLGITDVEPLQYKLVFERFLNLERKEMPDIDMDFQDDRRDEVLHYVIDKYGSDRVAQIITFGTMGARASLKDVGRALGMPYGEVDKIAKMVPMKARTLADARKQNAQMEAAIEDDERIKDLVEKAQGLEGTVHHVSTHAAGVLISEDPLTQTVPLQRPAKGEENSPVLMTQFSMDPVAKLGLLKMDFLGLTSLTILYRAVKLLKESQGIEIDLQKIPLDDPATFRLLSSGNTRDVFQLESDGIQKYIKELKPSSINDVAAMIALYRPGPMENIERFIDGKHGRIGISYPHDSFKEFLDETYGVIVYQDQVLHILQQFAGYSLGTADIVRKAMGKKLPKLMAEERANFMKGADGQGYGEELATEIFDLIEPFAGYAFNKAHSVSYAMLSYWTSWFKSHHPVEYMTSVLNSRMDNPGKTTASMNECWRLGIPMLPPDINRSDVEFTIDTADDGRRGIRIGLSAIKMVGAAAVTPLVEDRDANGHYRSIDEFCKSAGATGVNRRTTEAMIKAGAFDTLGKRGALLSSLDTIMGVIQREGKSKSKGQSSLFSPETDLMGPDEPRIELRGADATKGEKAAWEKELLGTALSHNPVLALASMAEGNTIVTTSDLIEEMEGQQTNVLGIVQHVAQRARRDGQAFYIITLEMLGGNIDVTVWPEAVKKTQNVWAAGKAVEVKGRVRVHNEEVGVTCEEAWQRPLPDSEDLTDQANEDAKEQRKVEEPWPVANDQTPEPAPVKTTKDAPVAAEKQPKRESTGRAVRIRMRETEDEKADIDRLRATVGILLDHPGRDGVLLDIVTSTETVRMEFPVVSTGYCDKLRTQLEELLGENAVTTVETEETNQAVAA